jgi:hypothetical protein
MTHAWLAGTPSDAGFRSARYRIMATSPGPWANATTVHIRFRRRGRAGAPELDLVVNVPGEEPEYLAGVDPRRVVEAVAEASAFVRLEPVGPEPAVPAVVASPSHLRWTPPALRIGDPPPAPPPPGELKQAYLEALTALGDQAEVALVAMPDLYRDLPPAPGVDDGPSEDVLRRAMRQAEELHDRMVLVTAPPGRTDPSDLVRWAQALAADDAPDARRAAAVYHPAVRVFDRLGGADSPPRSVPASGHVAGVISRLDRQRGAHHTPANAPAYEAVDVDAGFDAAAQGRMIDAGVNLVRCTPSRGLQVWGGRTLHGDSPHRFVAHRRLIHRLVRAARRVAEPLVFDTNGPEVWLAIARAMTTVLLEAFRAGALKGSKPDEAFRVRCDARTNPPEQRDLGRVVCEIDVAPAAPMEFIVLRIALGADGALEVFEP